ncbi:hypothetical protein MNB_SV-9-51 [hydrothermal vent metagenome]|uniref:Uncharacterized protein n=1 Tax=hydrothermal vent metagenome TaxID=652676 RepID=A0A1W1CF00_9ZZZZ
MKYQFLTNRKEIIKVDLFDENDIIFVSEPDNIIAFQSDNHENREDFIFDELKIKKYKVKSKIIGKSSFYVKSKNNSSIKIFEINKDTSFIFNFNILFYTQNIKIKTSIEDINKAIFKNDIFRYECAGNGILAYYVEGDSVEIFLSENETIFIHPNNVLGYDKNLSYEFKTYGNAKASMNMDYHYKFTGKGKIIIQTQSLSADIKISNIEAGDGFMTRFVKEVIPGANIILK